MSAKTVLPSILDILSDSLDISTIEMHSYPPLHELLELDKKSLNKILQRLGLDILCIVCKIGKEDSSRRKEFEVLSSYGAT